MSGKLHVGNLPSSATNAGLQTKFEQFGPVISAAIEIDSSTGRSKRSGLVEMACSEEAQAAIDRLNMTQYDETIISVYKVRLDNSA